MKKVAAFKTALHFKRILIILCVFTTSFSSFSQSIITIDGVNTTFSNGLSLPYWLKAGQSVGLVSNVKSISIIEFTADSNNLTFSRVISLTSPQTVPAGKVWKMEALGLGINGQTAGGFSTSSAPTIFTSPKTYSTAGTNTWIVPPGVTNICVEVWGGGGNGGSSYSYYAAGGGGGGGGYGYQCFSVVPGTNYTVTVGGVEGTSSVGTLISATGGGNGGIGPNGIGGVGGSSSATFNMSGANGANGGNGGGNGGTGANGGNGGGTTAPCVAGPGIAPGGGGGGAYLLSNCGSGGGNGGSGAIGKVIIYW